MLPVKSIATMKLSSRPFCTNCRNDAFSTKQHFFTYSALVLTARLSPPPCGLLAAQGQGLLHRAQQRVHRRLHLAAQHVVSAPFVLEHLQGEASVLSVSGACHHHVVAVAQDRHVDGDLTPGAVGGDFRAEDRNKTVLFAIAWG